MGERDETEILESGGLLMAPTKNSFVDDFVVLNSLSFFLVDNELIVIELLTDNGRGTEEEVAREEDDGDIKAE